jgi:hypothetical protein
MGIWIRLSFSVIVYNTYILDPKMYDWPFPVSLTMIHMAFCASLTAVLVRVVDTPTLPPMMPGLYAAYVIPIGVLYALSLWFSPIRCTSTSPSPSSRCSRHSCPSPSTPSPSPSALTHSAAPPCLTCSAGITVATYGEVPFDVFGVAL